MATRPRRCHQLGPSEEALMAHPSQCSGDAGGVECAAAVMASLSGLGYAGLTPPYKRLGWASRFWRASPMPWMFLMAEGAGWKHSPFRWLSKKNHFKFI